MTQSEYLQAFRTLHTKPRYHEEEALSALLARTAHNAGIEFQQIYSKTVYPQYIGAKSFDCVFWDGHFWDLYQRFLLGIHAGYSQTTNPNATFEYIHSIMMAFLTCRFEGVPSLGYQFCKRYAATGFAIPQYDKAEITPNGVALHNADYGEVLYYSKLYVFFHECTHHKLATDKAFKEADYADLLRITRLFAENWPKGEPTQLTAKKIVDEQNPAVIEEMCCDIRAVSQTIQMLSQMGHLQNRKEQVLQDYVVAIRFLLLFQGSLSQIEGTWRIALSGVKQHGQGYLLGSEFDTERRYELVELDTNARVNLILAISLYLHGPIDVPAFDFMDTDIFEKYIKPPLEFSRSAELINTVFQDYLYLEKKYTIAEFRTSTNMLLGWHN